MEGSYLLRDRNNRNVESNSIPTSTRHVSSNRDSDILQLNSVISKWSMCSTLEKSLSILLFVAIVVCIALTIVITHSLAENDVLSPIFTNESSLSSGYVIDKYGKSIAICEHQDCTVAASDIIQALDESYDPCKDFVQFSCGGWMKKNPVPEDSTKWSQFNILRRSLNIILNSILEKSSNTLDSKPLLKLSALYKGCLNDTQLELKGLKPLTDLLDIFGGWPMTKNNWNKENFDWLQVAAKVRQEISQTYVVNVYVSPDMKNTRKNSLYIDQPNFGIPRAILMEPDTYQNRISAYKNFIKSAAKLLSKEFDTTITDDELNKDVEDVYNFETELAKISAANEDRRDTNALYNKMSIQNLTEISHNTDWLEFFKIVFNLVEVDISNSTTIIVKEINYIKNMTKLINVTEKRIVANFLLWRMLASVADETTKAMRDITIDYKKVAYGIKSIQSRNIICTDTAIIQMGMAIGTKYTKDHFTKTTKEAANQMIENIRSSFKEMLSENQWMDDETKPLATDKANAINQVIGYPDWYDTDDGLEVFYENLGHIDPDEHFKNVFVFSAYMNQKGLKKLNDPVDKTNWPTSPVIVNAFYNPVFNSITFPAVILQPPFYRSTAPQYLNYGAIGQVIGHEITHGFDDHGRQFNKEGDAVPWWSENTIQKFKEETQCIIDQYDGFRVTELDTDAKNVTLNGKTTQGENIADNGGLRAAYRAYQKLIKENGEEPRLPGLTKYTSEQLFFIANAQIWCSSTTNQGLINQILTDPHSPANFRIIGPMSNMEEFSQIWNCPVGSTMNPENKCKIW